MKLLPGRDLLDRVQDVSNSIARRAFEMFEDRGRAFGHDLEDWLRAESEFLHPIHLDIAESDDAVTVRAEVPGFSAKELDVGVEPHRLTISGKREAKKVAPAKRPSTRNTAETKSSARLICLRRLTRRRLRPPSRMECWNSRCRRSPRHRRSGWKKSRRKVPSARGVLGSIHFQLRCVLMKQRRKAMKSDRELQIDVLDELRWEPGVNATDIGATVKDGVVTLEGTVDSYR